MRRIRLPWPLAIPALTLAVLACGSAARGEPGSASLSGVRTSQADRLDRAQSVPPAEIDPTASAAAEVPVVAPSWSAAPIVVTMAQPDPTSPPPPVRRVNRLISDDGSLNVGVGWYADCTGRSPIDTSRADLDPCFAGRAYFVGHSPGVFAPLLHMGVGSVITWFDDRGAANRLRVVAVRDMVRNSHTLLLAQPDVIAQFQTCLTLDGTLDRILDAVRA